MHLLAEVGIERLSTNQVAAVAGHFTARAVPVFPNKYALLHELGRRLMQAQNVGGAKWATLATLRSADGCA